MPDSLIESKRILNRKGNQAWYHRKNPHARYYSKLAALDSSAESLDLSGIIPLGCFRFTTGLLNHIIKERRKKRTDKERALVIDFVVESPLIGLWLGCFSSAPDENDFRRNLILKI